MHVSCKSLRLCSQTQHYHSAQKSWRVVGQNGQGAKLQRGPRSLLAPQLFWLGVSPATCCGHCSGRSRSQRLHLDRHLALQQAHGGLVHAVRYARHARRGGGGRGAGSGLAAAARGAVGAAHERLEAQEGAAEY